MKSKLILSLLALSLLPAQLDALVITVTKFKNNAGKSITLIGNISRDPITPEVSSDYDRLTNKQQNELTAYLKDQKDVQLIVDQQDIQDLFHAHAINPLMIKDDIQYKEFCHAQLPVYGLEFFTLEQYQTLLKKCADLEGSITALGNRGIKQKLTALRNQLKKHENQLRHFQTYINSDIPLGEIMDYEELIWDLRTIQMEIARYAYFVPVVTASAQQNNVYAYIHYEHIFDLDDSILSLNDFKSLGYNLVFEKKSSLENIEVDPVKALDVLALDLKTVLKKADNV